MKLLRRLLIVTLPFTAMAYAQATQWTNLAAESDLAYAVDVDSIATDSEGYVEYLAKTTGKTPATLPGATAPVAVSLTRYQMDCSRKRWRIVDTHYLAPEGAAAGSLHANDSKWTAIGPGTVVDAMFHKVC